IDHSDAWPHCTETGLLVRITQPRLTFYDSSRTIVHATRRPASRHLPRRNRETREEVRNSHHWHHAHRWWPDPCRSTSHGEHRLRTYVRGHRLRRRRPLRQPPR